METSANIYLKECYNCCPFFSSNNDGMYCGHPHFTMDNPEIYADMIITQSNSRNRIPPKCPLRQYPLTIKTSYGNKTYTKTYFIGTDVNNTKIEPHESEPLKCRCEFQYDELKALVGILKRDTNRIAAYTERLVNGDVETRDFDYEETDEIIRFNKERILQYREIYTSLKIKLNHMETILDTTK